MARFTNIGRATAFAAIGFSAAALGVLIATADPAFAAKAKAAAPAAPATEAEQRQQLAAATRQAYEAGIKSYSSGKFQPAVDQLSGALRGGGLGSAEMAKALYVRGVAYKKLSKPGLAISDLTSALWLKNGLGEADQAAAKAERAEAYRMAGLGDGTGGSDNVSVADPNPSPAGAKAAVPAVAIAQPKSAAPSASTPSAAPVVLAAGPTEGQVSRQSPESEAARDAANARRNAAQPVETNGLQAAPIGTLAVAPTIVEQPVATAPSLTAAAAPQQIAAAAPVLSALPVEGAPAAEAATPTSGAGSAISGFFSNMFGGGSSAAPAQDLTTAVTTASTSPPAATSSWSDSTSVASGASVKPAAPAKPIQQAALQPAPKAMPSGKYKLHIAAVRSRAEAEALAQKLSTQQGAALKSRMPVVDEAVIGSMGTFYRVRVGSFATAEEPRGVCNTLRSGGFDCLVVTN